MFERPHPGPTWVLCSAAAAATVLVAVGASTVARLPEAVAFAVAGVLCLHRARVTPAEAGVWRGFALLSGCIAAAVLVKAVFLALDATGSSWSTLASGLVLLGFPAAYRSLVRWGDGHLLVRDPHATAVGIAGLLLAVAWLEVWAGAGGPTAGWPLGHRMAAEIPAAAAVVLLARALGTPWTAGLVRDPRCWSVTGAVAVMTLLLLAPLARLDTTAWSPVVVVVAALALGAAARTSPRGCGVAAACPPTRTTMVETVAVLVQVVGVLVVTDLRATPLPVLLALAAGALVVVRLIRNLRDLSELAEARRQATTDELTGAANRRALLARIEEVTAGGDQVCLAVLDVDDFGTINDGLGQAGGDALLVAMTHRLQGALGDECLLGRLGGDDFAVVSRAARGAAPTDPVELGARLTAALAEPFEVAGLRLHLTVGTGLATTSTDDGHALFSRAEAAMRESRRLRTGPVVHDPGRHGDASGVLQVMEELRSALQHDELVLHLQPQIDVPGGRVDGVEALVRWQHPVRGLLGPFAFVPVAETHGLIGPLTERVLDLAIAQLAQWRGQGVRLRMSVNLSATNLLDDSLPERVGERLRAAGVDPGELALEITENVFVGDSSTVRAVLHRLAALGCDLSIDDYGTGWSTLGYLRDLPMAELKLDRSFTTDLTTDPRTVAIVGSTVDLAHTLGLRVVAEGVEDAETHAELTRLGCDLSQGYWHARPMPADEVLGWLAERTRPATTAG